jgi:hypothetical protein
MLLGDIANYLASRVVIPTYQTLMPETPDLCMVLYEYAGQSRERTFRGGTIIEHPGLQVSIRATDYVTARTKIELVIAALDGVANTVMGSTRYISIMANQSPTPLGRDENNRTRVSQNFIISKEVG